MTRIIIPILEAIGLVEKDRAKHPFKILETAEQIAPQLVPDDDQNIITTNWGHTRQSIPQHITANEETNTFEFSIASYGKTRLQMSAEMCWADDEVLKGTKISRKSYEKVRPFAIDGDSNKEIAERFGWKLSTAEKYGAKIRKAIRLYQQHGGVNPSPAQ